MKKTLILITCFICFGTTSFSQESSIEDTPKAETMPHFTGGDEAFYSYLDDNVKLPEGFDAETYLKENHNQYVPIAIGFTVDVDGSIVDVKIIEKTNKALDCKAKDIVLNMPKWVPGTLNGKPIKVQYAIPVRFNLM